MACTVSTPLHTKINGEYVVREKDMFAVDWKELGSSWKRACTSLHGKTSVCDQATIIKEAHSQRYKSLDN